MKPCALAIACLAFVTRTAAAQDSLTAAAAHAPPPIPPIGRLVDLGGRRLHINCTATGSPTVVVENGSSGFSMEWALVQPRVAAFTRICTYDRAGFAWSDRGPAENSVEETMDDLHQLLRLAGEKAPYVLVGHSIGGMYVRAYQRRYPAEVRGLVLVDATPEEDAEYLHEGKSVAGVFLTWDDMAALYAPLIRKPPPPFTLPTTVDEPQNRLSADLQSAYLWAIRQWLARVDQSHWWVIAESWREEFIALRNARLARQHALGDLPLVVIRRGLRTNDTLNRREADLAQLSSAGRLVIATKSDHEIFLYEPDLVVDAIHAVWASARRAHR